VKCDDGSSKLNKQYAMFTYVYVFSTYPDFAFLSLGLSATDRRALLSPPGSHSTAPCCHGLFGWEAPWWLSPKSGAKLSDGKVYCGWFSPRAANAVERLVWIRDAPGRQGKRWGDFQGTKMTLR